jgi:hypothetical protein
MGLEAMDDMNRLRVTDKTKEITADIFPNADGGKLPRTPQGPLGMKWGRVTSETITGPTRPHGDCR